MNRRRPLVIPRALCAIVPPYLLEALRRSDDPELAARAANTLAQDLHFRGDRLSPTTALREDTTTTGGTRPAADDGSRPNRSIHDAEHRQTLPGTLVRSEGDDVGTDTAVNQAYDGLGDTWELFHAVFGRDSLDDKGLPLIATVHYGTDYDNAFWNGEQMVFGDGDGKIFGPFTASVDVIGHELTHGVTEYTAGLRYQGQSGALNESISDVFGVLVKQRALGQTADQADWLIGADLLMPGVDGVALRSMKAPGTAYDDPQLGKDPQPATMADYVDTTGDNGGVHINSGIPNHAFYLVASTLGGNAWEAPGQIWYSVLTGGPIKADCDFAEFAALTTAAAAAEFGEGSAEHAAVVSAWQQVGVTDPGAASGGSGVGGSAGDPEKGGRHRAPEGDDPAPSAPSGSVGEGSEQALTVVRTGGFAGLTATRTVDLAALPAPAVEQLRGVLAGPDAAAGPVATHPDEFVYQLQCGDQQCAVAESSLPDSARDSLREAFGN